MKLFSSKYEKPPQKNELSQMFNDLYDFEPSQPDSQDSLSKDQT